MSGHYGLGQVAAIPTGANPTPIPFALLTDCKIDGDYSEVPLRGNMQFPQEIAFGEANLKVSAKNANVNGATLAAFLAGSTVTAGGVLGVLSELATIPATPYQVTVANGATFSENLGVLDLTANKWLTVVASNPATGQYSVSAAGVYTFAAADVGHNLAINYSYTSASIGKTTSLNNQVAGTTPIFALALYNEYTSAGATRYMGVRFPAVVCPKLSLSMAPTKWTEQDLSFSVRQSTSSSKIADFYTQE